MLSHPQRKFIKSMEASKAFLVREKGWTLKDGRRTCYYLDHGNASSGSALSIATELLVDAFFSNFSMINSRTKQFVNPADREGPDTLEPAKISVLFGPHSKGISYSKLLAAKLFDSRGIDIKSTCYDRPPKEDGHGDGRDFVGISEEFMEDKDQPLKGKDVVIVDDIIASGATTEAMIAYVKGLGGNVVGVITCTDRLEPHKDDSTKPASRYLSEMHNIPVVSGVTSVDIIHYLREKIDDPEAQSQAGIMGKYVLSMTESYTPKYRQLLNGLDLRAHAHSPQTHPALPIEGGEGDPSDEKGVMSSSATFYYTWGDGVDVPPRPSTAVLRRAEGPGQ